MNRDGWEDMEKKLADGWEDMEKKLADGWEEEVNQWGGVRRYRMVNGVKEYETLVTIDGATVPQSQVETLNRQRAASLQRQIENAKKAEQLKAFCPFKVMKEQMRNECRRECPFYDGNGCLFASSDIMPDTDANGAPCPFTGKCEARCAMYADGCKFAAFIKSKK